MNMGTFRTNSIQYINSNIEKCMRSKFYQILMFYFMPILKIRESYG